MGLDHLQPFVHHRRGIDRDFAAHDPVRMSAGLRRCHRRERVGRTFSEGPTGGCQKDPLHAARLEITGIIGRQRLKDRIMFAINGQQTGAATTHGLHEHRAGHDQRFLIGQQNFFSGPCGGRRRRQPRRANDGGHHRVDLWQLCHVHQRVRTTQNLRDARRGGQSTPQSIGQRFVAHDRVTRCKLETLLEQTVDLGVRTQGFHTVTLWMLPDHIERTDADRTGRTKNRKRLHHRQIEYSVRHRDQTGSRRPAVR